MKLRSSRNQRRKARIEIIPLIDIMFFLLATFVMVSTAMIKNRGISVRLPVADTGAKEERHDAASTTVTEQGEYFYDKTKVSLDELKNNLQSLKAGSEDAKVFINGDAKASVESLVTALDEVRKVGISKVALETATRGK